MSILTAPLFNYCDLKTVSFRKFPIVLSLHSSWEPNIVTSKVYFNYALKQ